MSRLAKKIVLSLSVLVFAYVAMGYVLGKTNDDKTYRSLTVFSEVLEHIQHDYVEDPNMRQVETGAMHGLLESLDPQSSYLSAREYADYKNKLGNEVKASAGLELSKRFGYIAVVAVLPDSPAQKANIRGGDLLESIAGFTTRQMAVGQAQVLLSGEPGTAVKASVIHRGGGEAQEVDLILAKVPAPKLIEDKMVGDIVYLRVPTFDRGVTGQIRDKLIQMDHQGAHKLILDLRDCARGQVAEGVSTAQLFLPSGNITTVRGQTVSSQTFAADPSKVVWNQPVAVLISTGTAGPAEIVASAIADNHRGQTIGTTTFGTASEQKVIPMDDGAALILTVANYFTPGGKSIPADGVAPSVEVRPSLDDLGSQNPEQAAPQPGQPPSPDDPVVKKAIEILQGAAQRRAA
jgi:carboxyl-terminal processing protease